MTVLLLILIGPLLPGLASDLDRELRKVPPARRAEVLATLPERMGKATEAERRDLAPLLLGILKDPDRAELHASVLRPLLLTGTEAGAGAVVRSAYAQEESPVRSTARAAFSRDGSDLTTAHLVSFLKRDRSERARAWICLFLGSRGRAGATAAGALVGSLRDPHPMVRGAAAEALVRIRGQTAGYDAEAWKELIAKPPPGAAPKVPPVPPKPGETVTEAPPPPDPGKRLMDLVPLYYGIPLDRRVVVAVLDFSGSVRGPKGTGAREELRRKLSLLPTVRRFTVIAFDERLFTLFPEPRTADPDAKVELAEFLRGLPPGKRTELLLPIHVGLTLARKHGKEGAQVLIVSDGAPTVDGPPLRAVLERARGLAEAGVRVDVAMLGGDAGLFRFLTRETGGQYVTIR